MPLEFLDRVKVHVHDGDDFIAFDSILAIIDQAIVEWWRGDQDEDGEESLGQLATFLRKIRHTPEHQESEAHDGE